MKNKKTLMRFTAWIMALCFLVVTAIQSPVSVSAADSSQSVVTKSVSSSSFKKVTASVKKDVVATASSKNYTAQLVGSDKTDEDEIMPEYLLVTKDGKSYTKVNLVKKAAKKLNVTIGSETTRTGDDSSYTDVTLTTNVYIYDITCINNTFYITGGIVKVESTYSEGSWGGGGSISGITSIPFFIKTTNGKKLTIQKLSKKIGNKMTDTMNTYNSYYYIASWTLNYSGGYYVALPDYMCYWKDDSNAVYYVSKDLKKWTKKNMNGAIRKVCGLSTYGYVSIANVTEDGVVFYVEGANGERSYIYTKDFKSYKKVSTFNTTFVSDSDNGVYTWATIFSEDPTYAMLNETSGAYNDNGDYVYSGESLKLLRSDGINNYKKCFDLEGNWETWYSLCFASGISNTYIDTSDKSYVYIADSSTDSFDKYTTSLSASKIGENEESGSWTFTVYDSRYILLSNNSGRTVYKIDTGKKNISNIFVQGSNLVLCIDGGYDYYIPVSTLTKAVK